MAEDATPVIAAGARTPIGTDGGAFAETRSEDLSIALIEHLLEATGLAPGQVDDLRWGCAQQRGEQDNNLARVIALLSPLGESVPATTINRWCASSMEAIAGAADAVRAGQRTCLIAGGVENMSRVPMAAGTGDLHPGLADRYDVGALQMGMTAEAVAEAFDVSRAAMDAYALRSHERAAEATDTGRFADEIVPVETDAGRITEDEGIRRETSLEALGGLRPAFVADGRVTAGNASQISDGAAAVLVTSEAFAEANGLDVLARVGAHHVAGVDPTLMGLGPIPATEGLLERTGLTIDDFDLVELNEAFASQCLHCQSVLGVPDDRFNVNGGAIALGHPLGASGARLPVTLLSELAARDADRGLATLCVGFGQGMAIAFDRP